MSCFQLVDKKLNVGGDDFFRSLELGCGGHGGDVAGFVLGNGVKRGYWHDNFLLMNGTMDDLAYVLATGLENPVLNETGIDSTYDARFKVAGGDVGSLNAVLKETLGLELVPGNREMSITVLEVSKQVETKPSSSTKTQEVKQ